VQPPQPQTYPSVDIKIPQTRIETPRKKKKTPQKKKTHTGPSPFASGIGNTASSPFASCAISGLPVATIGFAKTPASF
jgi:hypothetical protein